MILLFCDRVLEWFSSLLAPENVIVFHVVFSSVFSFLQNKLMVRTFWNPKILG